MAGGGSLRQLDALLPREVANDRLVQLAPLTQSMKPQPYSLEWFCPGSSHSDEPILETPSQMFL